MPQNYPMWSGAFWSAKERDRLEQQRLDKELERELVRYAAQAGYSRDQAREIAQMQIKGAEERQAMENEARLAAAHVGETAAGNRQDRTISAATEQEKRARSDDLERLILQNMSARELAAMGADNALALERARAEGAKARDQAEWERNKGMNERLAAIRAFGALGSFANSGEEVLPGDYVAVGLPPRGESGTTPLSTRAKPSAPAVIPLSKPVKPGETPRTLGNAAVPPPATPAAAPSAVVRSNDVPSIGTAPAEMPGTNAPVTWRDISLHPTSWDPEGRRKNSALIEQFLQQLDTGRTSRIAPKL